MAITEIEKLERRFAENPQGFSFAPLAEAYRKSGGGGPTRYGEARVSSQVGRPCKAG